MEEKKKDVLRPTDAEAVRLAKTLVRTARYGALATLDPDSGAPIATRVALATDLDGTPIILISALSAHTGALRADPRCSLLVGEPGKGDPLAYARMSVACLARSPEPGSQEAKRVARRYLNCQPKAKLYADFPDFSFFRLEPQGASLNGGFGRAYHLERDDLIVDSPANEALAASEQSALNHMNDDHRDAIGVYARAFAGAKDDGDWFLTGIDADGVDLSNGDEARRAFFPAPLTDGNEVRPALVELARSGRAKLGQV